MTSVRYIVICLEPDSRLDITKLKAHPGAEVYFLSASSPDVYQEITLAILRSLHSRVRLGFVGGGDQGKAIAETYCSTWIGTPDSTEEVLKFWDAPCDDPWNLPTGVDLVQFEICNRNPNA